MRNLLLMLPPILLTALGPSRAAGQDWHSVGFYAGTSLREIDEFRIDAPRIGINYTTKLFGPVEVYPGLDLIPEEIGSNRFWQANIYLRVWPLRQGTSSSFWFVGLGVVVQSSGAYEAIMSGLSLPFGKYKPFIQVQWWGTYVNGGGPAAELLAGFYLQLH